MVREFALREVRGRGRFADREAHPRKLLGGEQAVVVEGEAKLGDAQALLPTVLVPVLHGGDGVGGVGHLGVLLHGLEALRDERRHVVLLRDERVEVLHWRPPGWGGCGIMPVEALKVRGST